MKKKFVVMIVALLLAVLPLAACGDSGENAAVTYDETVNFDLLRPADVLIKFTGAKVDKITLSSRTLEKYEYSVDGGVIRLRASLFEDVGSGVKDLKIYVGKTQYPVKVRVFSATLYTPSDFNLIRLDPSGSYRLGSDVDFAGIPFEPIGRSNNKPFAGVFDGQGYSVKNVLISEKKSTVNDAGERVFPQDNGANYNNGVFYSISGNGIVENTNFLNVTLDTMGLSGAVAGTNGGTIRNCFVSVNMQTGFDGNDSYYERGAGIAGVNGTGDSAGLIENCVVLARWAGGTPFQYRMYADWNIGTVRNCRAATYNDDFKSMNLKTINLKSDWYNDTQYIDWEREEAHLKEDNYNADILAGFYDDNFILPCLGGNLADNLITVNGNIITSDGESPRYCVHDQHVLLNGTYIDDTPTGTAECGCPKYAYKIFFRGGTVQNAYILKMSMMTDKANFTDFDTDLWEIKDGAIPMLKPAAL